MNKVYFLSGPPLSGKDTQAKLLAKKLKAKVLTTSKVIEDFFKKHKGNYIKIGKRVFDIRKEQAKRYSGGLYSPFLIGHILLRKILELINKSDLVISGSPRTLEETKIIIKGLKENKIDFKVILIKISEEEIFKRAIKRKRGEEDFQNIVKRRIENYKKYTLPALNYLKRRKKVVEVNGEGKIREIHFDILNKIKTNEKIS
jgi:adenylate kinase